ncbi:MAG: hypothetical protein K2M00_07500 [Muribaculaceae bacterium]|nr:hypothetical protein [Muribaculaceae bacterium]
MDIRELEKKIMTPARCKAVGALLEKGVARPLLCSLAGSSAAVVLN